MFSSLVNGRAASIDVPPIPCWCICCVNTGASRATRNGLRYQPVEPAAVLVNGGQPSSPGTMLASRRLQERGGADS